MGRLAKEGILGEAITLPFMNFANLDRDRGGLLVRDMKSRLRTTLLKLLSVLLTKKL